MSGDRFFQSLPFLPSALGAVNPYDTVENPTPFVQGRASVPGADVQSPWDLDWQLADAEPQQPTLRGTIDDPTLVPAPAPAPKTPFGQQITGTIQSIIDPIVAGAPEAQKDITQTSSLLWGKNYVRAPGSSPELEAPITSNDSPGIIGQKALFQATRFFPTAVAGSLGALVAPEAGVAALAGGAVGTMLGTFGQVLGQNFDLAHKAHPDDPDAAYAEAVKTTVVDTGAAGLGALALGVTPFAGALKNALFQTLVVQPTVGVAGSKLHQFVAGQDSGLSLTDEYLNMVAPSALMAGVGEVAHRAARAAGEAPWALPWREVPGEHAAFEIDPEVSAAIAEEGGAPEEQTAAAQKKRGLGTGLSDLVPKATEERTSEAFNRQFPTEPKPGEPQPTPPPEAPKFQRGSNGGPALEPFYYKSERLLDEMKTERATGDQWHATFRNKGIKVEELDDLGITDLLKQHADIPVTKDQIKKLIDVNRAEFKEVNYGESAELAAARDKRLNDIQDGFDDLYGQEGPEIDRRRAELAAEADAMKRESPHAPRFSEFVMPGGKNYREKVLSLPPTAAIKRSAEITDRMKVVKQRQDELSAKQREDAARDGAAKPSQELADLNLEWQKLSGEFRSIKHESFSVHEHWPGVENPLGHLRMTDRVATDGIESDHIEEAQSDIHNKGKKQGYAPGPNFKRELAQAREARDDAENAYNKTAATKVGEMHKQIREFDKGMRERTPLKWIIYDREDATKPIWESKPGDDVQVAVKKAREIGAAPNQIDRSRIFPEAELKNLRELQDELVRYRKEVADPAYDAWQQASARAIQMEKAGEGSLWSAPFKKSYAKLMLKKMMADAIARGRTRITWSTGEQVSESQGLNKVLSRMSYRPQGKDWVVTGYDHNGREVDTIDGARIPDSELEKHVGKDVAERMRKKEGGRATDEDGNRWLSGNNLKAIPAGKSQFYDVILREAARELVGKKNVGMVKTDTGKGVVDVHAMDIPPEVARDVQQKGQSMYQRGAAPSGAYEEVVATKHSLSKEELKRFAPLLRDMQAAIKSQSPSAKFLPVRKLITTTESGKKGEVYGSFFPQSDVGPLIVLALDGPDGFNTKIAGSARHEVVHSLRAAKVILPHEWQALEDEAIKKGWLKKYNINARYSKLDRTGRIEEAIAERQGDKYGDSLDGTLHPLAKRALRKIRNLLSDVKTAVLKHLGHDVTAREVMAKIESGAMGWRRPQPTEGGEAKFQRIKNPIDAWHGGPHDHDEFQSSKIGTGEGGAMYGRGHYFAKMREVGEEYRRNLGPKNKDAVAKIAKSNGLSDEAAKAIADYYDGAGHSDMALARFIETTKAPGPSPTQEAFRARMRKQIPAITAAWPELRKAGKLYNVDLHIEPHQMVDWDAPLTKQPAAVRNLARKFAPKSRETPPWDAQKVLNQAMRENEGRPEHDALILTIDNDQQMNAAAWDLMEEELGKEKAEKMLNDGESVGDWLVRHYAGYVEKKGFGALTGGELVNLMHDKHGEHTTSQMLKDAGVRGIKYLDNFSRGRGTGTHNYVALHDEDIAIKAKFQRGKADEDRYDANRSGDNNARPNQPAAEAGTTAQGLPVGRGVPGGGRVLPAQDARDTAPLVGLPTKVAIPGHPDITAGPFATARRIARDYVESTGRPYNPIQTYAKVDPARAKRIADAYDAMKSDPQDPAVRAAYTAMAKETLDQWQHVKKTGLKVEFLNPANGDPYAASPRLAVEDVKKNNHLWVFSTDDGYGTAGITAKDIADNPMLDYAPGEKIGDRPARINDIFRVVHDYFGHIKDGVGFRADGEENAWRSHAKMYSPEAVKAMTSETRGQNSWLNYGPYGEKNRTAKSEDTVYAEQKIGIMPDWVTSEGLDDPKPKFQRGQTGTPEFKRWFGKSKGVDAKGKPRLFYHGTHYDFDTFSKTHDIGYHFGDAAHANDRLDIDGLDPNHFRPGKNVMPVYLKIERPLRLPDLGTWEPYHVADELLKKGIITEKQRRYFENRWQHAESFKGDVRHLLAEKGYDSIVYRNEGEGKRPMTLADFDRIQIKKVGEKGGEFYEARLPEGDSIGYAQTAGDALNQARHAAREGREITTGDSYIVFDSRQIKSAFNSGKFDSENPKFMMQRGNAQTETDAFKKWFGRGAITNPDGSPRRLFHTSVSGQFDAFKRKLGDIGVHFGTEGQARDRYELKHENDPYAATLKGVEHNTIPVYLNLKKPLRVDDVGWFNFDNMASAIRQRVNRGELPHYPWKPDLLDIERKIRTPNAQLAALRKLIERQGYDGLVYKNSGETGGALEFRKAEEEARRAMYARFPKQNSFSEEDQAVPEYKAFSAAHDAYREYREKNAEDSYVAFHPEQIKSAIGNRGTFDPKKKSILMQRGSAYVEEFKAAWGKQDETRQLLDKVRADPDMNKAEVIALAKALLGARVSATTGKDAALNAIGGQSMQAARDADIAKRIKAGLQRGGMPERKPLVVERRQIPQQPPYRKRRRSAASEYLRSGLPL